MTNIKPIYEVRQSNVLTESRFDFTAIHLDIYFYLLSAMKKTDSPATEYEIHLTHMKEITGREWNYQQLRKSTKELIGRVIEFYDREGNFVQTGLLASTKYMTGKGYLKVTVSRELFPLMVELKEHYTSFELYCALAMTSKFAKRLYMLCSEWKNNQIKKDGSAVSRVYTVDELRYMLELTDPKGIKPDQFKQWTEFKEYILEIGKNQINKYSDLKISYEAIKVGRSYEKIRFNIQKGNQHQLLIDFKHEDLQHHISDINKQMLLMENYGLSEKQAKTVIRRFDKRMVNDILAAVDEAKKSGKIKTNIGGYTVTALKNKFGVEI